MSINKNFKYIFFHIQMVFHLLEIWQILNPVLTYEIRGTEEKIVLDSLPRQALPCDVQHTITTNSKGLMPLNCILLRSVK